MRFRLKILLFLLLTILLFIISVAYGHKIYSLQTMVAVFSGAQIKGATFEIMSLRLPRTICALLVGAMFGIAGNIFQTLLRNPLASPDVIGITSSSSTAAVFCILFLRVSSISAAIISIIAGLSVAIIIYLLASKNKFSTGKMILVGIGVEAIMSSLTSYFMLSGNRYDISSAMRWLTGSLNSTTMNEIYTPLITLCVAGVILLIYERKLMIMELGDELPILLGLNTKNVIKITIISSVFLIAVATSVSGPVAFVSFLAGPVTKKIIGYGNPRVLASAFVGAIIVLFSDFLGKHIFNYPVGVLTSIMGGTYFLILLVKKKNRSVEY